MSSERIGDPTREKWMPFLDKCLVLGYIDADEHFRRTDILDKAKTSAEAEKAYKDLPWEPWSDAWNKGREKGLYRKLDILPDQPEQPAENGKLTAADTAGMAVLTVALLGGWLMFFLLLAHVI